MSTATEPQVNYWPESKCAKAFWSQHEIPPYKRLLADTVAWLDPQAGASWLDLGCGCGQLTQALWAKSQGSLASITGQDCAAVNEQAFARLCLKVQPTPPEGAIQFRVGDFSNGLPQWSDGRFDGVVSGLAIQYAEHYSEAEGRWTTTAYDRLLCEIHRVLRPGGQFVFSVNVPEPNWGKVALLSFSGVFGAPKPGRYLKNSLRMLRYGSWLSQEARRGRFHYLPQPAIVDKLKAAGFGAIQLRLTYAGQAYLFRCRKPA